MLGCNVVHDALDLVPHDTDADSYAAQIEAYRRLGPSGRGEAAFRLTATARALAVSGIERRHPEYDAAQLARALLRLRYGDEVARAVWPDHPLVDP